MVVNVNIYKMKVCDMVQLLNFLKKEKFDVEVYIDDGDIKEKFDID